MNNKIKKVTNGTINAAKTVVAVTASAAIAEIVALQSFLMIEATKEEISERRETMMVKDKKHHPFQKRTYTEVYVKTGKPVKKRK